MTDARAAQIGLAVRLDVRPVIVEAGRPVRWVLTVTNHGPHTRSLTFPTTQPGDVVLETDAVEWYRWGDHWLFLPGKGETELAVRATWQCVLDDTLRVPPGQYRLHATVTADPRPPVVRKEVRVHQPSSRPAAAYRPYAAVSTGGPSSSQVGPVRRVTSSPPSVTLYGQCRQCQCARVLRTIRDAEDLVRNYEVACTRCGNSEPLRRSLRASLH